MKVSTNAATAQGNDEDRIAETKDLPAIDERKFFFSSFFLLLFFLSGLPHLCPKVLT